LRSIAVLMAYEESDPKAKGWLSWFKRSLIDLGWIDGRKIRMDVRWAAGDVDRMQRFTKESVEQRPDAILSSSTPRTAAFQRETRTIPIVFVVVADPLGSSFVTSLPCPGGNITGFSFVDVSMAGKLVELLTEIAPGVVRIAIMFNPDAGTFTGQYYLPPFEAPVRSASEIEAVIKLLASAPGGALVVQATPIWIIIVRRSYRWQPNTNSDRLYTEFLGPRWWFAVLWSGFRRYVSPCRGLCGSHSPWHKARGTSCATSNQI
jgi:putative tryptophan/tyrosine transport system substrate-binding protein